MPNPRSRLIETAIRPFHDNAEMEMAASDLLEKLSCPDDEGADRAVHRWNAVDAKSSGRFWQTGLWLALVVTAAFVVARDFREVGRYVAWRAWIGGNYGASTVKRDKKFFNQLRPSQKLLLGGSKSSEALWRSDPEDPAYLAEYAIRFSNEHRSLPTDFLENARRIDPQNAWFTWLAAAVEAKGGMESRTIKHKEPDGTTRDVETWVILDQARVDRARTLIVEARNQPKFENYGNAMLLKRRALFPERNLVGHMEAIAQISKGSISSNVKLADAVFLLAGRSKLAAEAGDIAGFQDICQDGDRLLRHMAGSEAETILSGVVEAGALVIISQRFAEGAQKLGLETDAKRWKTIYDKAVARKAMARSNIFMVDGEAADPLLVGRTVFGNDFEIGPNAVAHPPALTDADLKPGRMLDHEILSRFCGYLSWLVMGLFLLIVAGYRFRVSRLVRRTASRMEQLLEVRDWAWILIAGIVLPSAFVMAINRLTPLGGRQFGMLGNAMLLPAGHFFGLVLLWLIVPAQVIRNRLAKRAALFGFQKSSWLGWTAAICAAAFVPLIGWAAIHRSFPNYWAEGMNGWDIELPLSGEPWRFWLAVGTLAIPFLWLIAVAFRTLVCQPDRLVHSATTAQALVKPLVAAMVLLALATIAFKASEAWWFQRDWMARWDPATPGWSAYEARISRQSKNEQREILGYEK